MSAATDQLSEIEAKVLDVLVQIQEPVVAGVRSAAEWAESVLPDVKVPNLDRLGSADELVAFGFGVVDDVVKNQKAFVADLLDATAPARAKFIDADAKPVKPVKTVKTGKAASAKKAA